MGSGRMVLCYVQGSGRRKRKKGVGCGRGRQENYGSGRRDCGRIRIWDPGIKRVFQDNILRTRKANEEIKESHTRVHELEKQVEKLPMELQLQNNFREALETKDLEKKMIDLNSTLHDLQKVKTKCALKIDDLRRLRGTVHHGTVHRGGTVHRKKIYRSVSYCSSVLIFFFFELLIMASNGSDQDARYALFKLLQRGTVTEYESEFLMLIKRVMGISESLLKSFYISGLKSLIQCALLRLAPITLGEAFSIARIMEARFETIAGKKLNIEEKIDVVLSWSSKEAPPVIKGSLDANEDIGVVEVSSTIDDVFDIGKSNVESMEVRSEFSEFLELNRVIPALKDRCGEFDGHLDEINLNLSEELAENGVSPIPTSFMAHESPLNNKFVQPNVWGCISDSQSAYSSYHLEGKVIFEGVGSVTAWVAKGGRMVLCYVQGSGRRKRKKGVGCGSERQENYRSGRRDCGRIRIWDPRIERGANASVNEGERSGDLEDTNISSEGDEVHIDPQEVSLQINEGASQRKYALDLIAEIGLLVGKPSYMPLHSNIALSSEPTDTDPKLKIQFMHNPLKSHLDNALKFTSSDLESTNGISSSDSSSSHDIVSSKGQDMCSNSTMIQQRHSRIQNFPSHRVKKAKASRSSASKNPPETIIVKSLVSTKN
ncbi:hypothetical protein Tco_0083846 [Tanacetum coccineum]